jgi:hypothetical protein
MAMKLKITGNEDFTNLCIAKNIKHFGKYETEQG